MIKSKLTNVHRGYVQVECKGSDIELLTEFVAIIDSMNKYLSEREVLPNVFMDLGGLTKLRDIAETCSKAV